MEFAQYLSEMMKMVLSGGGVYDHIIKAGSGELVLGAENDVY